MKFSFHFLYFFLFIFLSTFHIVTPTNLIHETCKKCAHGDPNLSYKFCTSSLQSAPASRCANLSKLGLLTMRLIEDSLTDTRCYIKVLLKNKKLDPFVKVCLNDCFELYSDAIPSLKKAMDNYKAKHYRDCNIELSAVADAPTTCEDGFMEKEGLVSPLTRRNNDTFQLSAIALSIMNMLH